MVPGFTTLTCPPTPQLGQPHLPLRRPALAQSLAHRLASRYDDGVPSVEHPWELIDDNKVRACSCLSRAARRCRLPPPPPPSAADAAAIAVAAAFGR